MTKGKAKQHRIILFSIIMIIRMRERSAEQAAAAKKASPRAQKVTFRNFHLFIAYRVAIMLIVFKPMPSYYII